MMRTFEMNVGLENNPFNAYAVEKIIARQFSEPTTIKTRLHVGEWNGQPEETLIVKISTFDKRKDILKITKNLCSLLTQDAIAIKDNDGGLLVYNDNFEGEKFTFDTQYFINY